MSVRMRAFGIGTLLVVVGVLVVGLRHQRTSGTAGAPVRRRRSSKEGSDCGRHETLRRRRNRPRSLGIGGSGVAAAVQSTPGGERSGRERALRGGDIAKEAIRHLATRGGSGGGERVRPGNPGRRCRGRAGHNLPGGPDFAGEMEGLQWSVPKSNGSSTSRSPRSRVRSRRPAARTISRPPGTSQRTRRPTSIPTGPGGGEGTRPAPTDHHL